RSPSRQSTLCRLLNLAVARMSSLTRLAVTKELSGRHSPLSLGPMARQGSTVTDGVQSHGRAVLGAANQALTPSL
ncbi:hypothetical protein, partial [Flavimaricola marinus]|uniref:hypothetical protein n=1 Tax=Flavimaricola marinus TaxID=1819565 RepID=UPI001B3B3C0F